MALLCVSQLGSQRIQREACGCTSSADDVLDDENAIVVWYRVGQDICQGGFTRARPARYEDVVALTYGFLQHRGRTLGDELLRYQVLHLELAGSELPNCKQGARIDHGRNNGSQAAAVRQT